MKCIARIAVPILAVAVLGTLLVACGGGEDEGSEQPTVTEEAQIQTETPTPAAVEEEPFVPRRGCGACHRLVDAETGKYTLPYEAHERAEARGLLHPEVALDGTPMARTDEVALDTCMGCHAPGAAPVLSMQEIVHPAHAFSEHFADERGNCFSCHSISPEGAFDVISGSLEVNEKGVPEPPPSEE